MGVSTVPTIVLLSLRRRVYSLRVSILYVACSINQVPPYSNIGCEQGELPIRIAVRQTFLAEIEHGTPVSISFKLGNGAKGHLLSAATELCSRRKDRTGDEFLKVLGASVCLDNVIEQKGLFFCFDASRGRFGSCPI
jgi:hypothetical protein